MGIFDKLFGKKTQPEPQPVPDPAPSKVDDITARFHEAISNMVARQQTEVYISVPREIDGKQLAYKYDDVQLTPAGAPVSAINPKEQLTLKENGDKVDAYQGDLFIGTLPANSLSGMVHDWNRDADRNRFSEVR